MPAERRLQKINEFIYRFTSEYLERELDADSLVTVSEVSTSGNGQECKIGVTVFPFGKSQAVLKDIQKIIYEMQKKLNRTMKTRPVPKLIFEIDDSVEKGSKVLQKISEVEKNGL